MFNTINEASDGYLFTPTSVTGNYTVNVNDQIILVDNAANCSIILPNAAVANGKRYVVKKISTGTATVTVVGESGNIDDGATAVITMAYESIDCVSDGVDYWIV